MPTLTYLILRSVVRVALSRGGCIAKQSNFASRAWELLKSQRHIRREWVDSFVRKTIATVAVAVAKYQLPAAIPNLRPRSGVPTGWQDDPHLVQVFKELVGRPRSGNAH